MGHLRHFNCWFQQLPSLAAMSLGWMGYGTVLGTENGMPTLQVTGSLGTATKFAIAWPCAGIESLLIFTAVALLFLQRMPMSWKAKIGYFAVGAAITYFINVLRIDTIFTIGMQIWRNSRASARLPLLLWTTILNCMDSFFSVNYYTEPNVMAKNQNKKNRLLQKKL